jgi:hypothetical protein
MQVLLQLILFSAMMANPLHRFDKRDERKSNLITMLSSWRPPLKRFAKDGSSVRHMTASWFKIHVDRSGEAGLW